MIKLQIKYKLYFLDGKPYIIINFQTKKAPPVRAGLKIKRSCNGSDQFQFGVFLPKWQLTFEQVELE